MTANRTLVWRKCANVINAYADLAGIPIRQAFDVFYRSCLYALFFMLQPTLALLQSHD